LDPTFGPVERAELLDAAEACWGRSRVFGLPDVPRLRATHWVLVRWVSILGALAVTLYAVRDHWGFGARTLAVLAILAPAVLARKFEQKLYDGAPRR
jgi:hypothetical protein